MKNAISLLMIIFILQFPASKTAAAETFNTSSTSDYVASHFKKFPLAKMSSCILEINSRYVGGKKFSVRDISLSCIPQFQRILQFSEETIFDLEDYQKLRTALNLAQYNLEIVGGHEEMSGQNTRIKYYIVRSDFMLEWTHGARAGFFRDECKAAKDATLDGLQESCDQKNKIFLRNFAQCSITSQNPGVIISGCGQRCRVPCVPSDSNLTIIENSRHILNPNEIIKASRATYPKGGTESITINNSNRQFKEKSNQPKGSSLSSGAIPK